MSVVDVADLNVWLTRDRRESHVLRGVDLKIEPGEILGLVGESGSGKSVLGLSLLGLLPGSAGAGDRGRGRRRRRRHGRGAAEERRAACGGATSGRSSRTR